MRIIYDVGASTGEEVDYYLKCADRVVCIEANPSSVEVLKRDFGAQLGSGRLVIIDRAIHDQDGDVTFYVNRKASVLSRLKIGPWTERFFGELGSPDAWVPIQVKTIQLSDVISEHGEPYFIKVDVESADEMAFRDLLAHGIRPPYISGEYDKSFRSICAMYLMGYRGFQVVNMTTVEHQFRGHPIRTLSGAVERYDFKYHSSGPFGHDLPDAWVPFEVAIGMVVKEAAKHPGCWFDIHARLQAPGNP